MKYKVVSKVIASEELIGGRGLQRVFNFEDLDFVAYKIIVGLYIFYISNSTYAEGLKQGIIEPISSEVPVLPYEETLMCRGAVVNHRMSYAVKHSTIKYLTDELNKIRSGFKRLTVKVYNTKWEDGCDRFKSDSVPVLTYIEEVSVDIENQIITNMSSSEIKNVQYVSVFGNIKTYEDFLDRLAYYLNREFMNSRNLFEKYKENDFYDVDYWMQRMLKFEFIFE